VQSCGRPHTQETTAGGDRPLQHSSRQAAACQPTRGSSSSSNNQKNKQQRPRLRALWQQQATNVPRAPPAPLLLVLLLWCALCRRREGGEEGRTTQRQQGQRERGVVGQFRQTPHCRAKAHHNLTRTTSFGRPPPPPPSHPTLFTPTSMSVKLGTPPRVGKLIKSPLQNTLYSHLPLPHMAYKHTISNRKPN